jgi:uncharacterized protein involved in exopolysaccharide biosynthesis
MTSLSEDGDIVVDRPRANAAEAASAPPYGAGFASPQVTLRDILTIVFFDRWAILVAFLVPVLLGVAAALVTRTTYEAEARLLVLLGREYVFRPEVGENVPGLSFDREQIVKAELEILGSRELKAEVIRTIGLEDMYPRIEKDQATDAMPVPAGTGEGKRRPRAMDLAIEQFEKNLKLAAVQGSNVIQLAFNHPDPQVAAEALNLLVRFYMDKRRDVFSQSRSAIIQDQRDQFGQRLQESEARIREFRARNNVANVDEQTSLLLRQEADQTSALLQLDERVRGLEAQAQGLKAQIAAMPAQILLSNDSSRAPALESARATLLSLELRRRDLLAKYKETSRVIADIDAQIAQARASMAEDKQRITDTVRRGRNPVLDDLERDLARLEAEVKGARARRAEIEANIAKLKERLAGLAEQQQAFRALERERALLEDAYRTYTRRLEEAKITDEFDRSKSANVRIIASAEPPSEGRSLRLPIMAAAIFLGLVTALATAFVVAQMRQTFLTPEDTERVLGLPVLLAVPLRDRNRTQRGQR